MCAILGLTTSSVLSARGRGGEAGGTWLPQVPYPQWRWSHGQAGRPSSECIGVGVSPHVPVCLGCDSVPVGPGTGGMGNYLGVSTAAVRSYLCSNLFPGLNEASLRWIFLEHVGPPLGHVWQDPACREAVGAVRNSVSVLPGR